MNHRSSYGSLAYNDSSPDGNNDYCIGVVLTRFTVERQSTEYYFGVSKHRYWTPGETGAEQTLNTFITHHIYGYKINRDFPAKEATSYLSPHLHFGEISRWAILNALEYARLDSTCDLIRCVRAFTP